MGITDLLRASLRRQRRWLEFQESRREGFLNAVRRRRIQKRILSTPPIYTCQTGSVELHTLTWRRDWINLLWALKSFYHFSGVDYPLHVHDGGLTDESADCLRSHFPRSIIISKREADEKVETTLATRGLSNCLKYRSRNPAAQKLFDFILCSSSEWILSIDSDIVFFRKPTDLMVECGQPKRNRYNKDSGFWYSMPVDDLHTAFGLRVPERVNSGLSLIRRTSVTFEQIEEWLRHPKLFEDRWVTEQTLHALLGGVQGVEFLPDTYVVDTKPRLTADTVCKHYPGFFRHLLYQEGMAHLINTGFLAALNDRSAPGETP